MFRKIINPISLYGFQNLDKLKLRNVLPFGAYRIFPYFYINNFV